MIRASYENIVLQWESFSRLSPCHFSYYLLNLHLFSHPNEPGFTTVSCVDLPVTAQNDSQSSPGLPVLFPDIDPGIERRVLSLKGSTLNSNPLLCPVTLRPPPCPSPRHPFPFYLSVFSSPGVFISSFVF